MRRQKTMSTGRKVWVWVVGLFVIGSLVLYQNSSAQASFSPKVGVDYVSTDILTEWTVEEVDGKTALACDSAINGNHEIHYVKEVLPEEFVIRGQIRSSTGWAGLIFNFKDQHTYYCLRVMVSSGEVHLLAQTTSGWKSFPGTKGLVLPKDEWFDITVRRYVDRIEYEVGDYKGSYTPEGGDMEPDYEGGYAGFYTAGFGRGNYFTNLQIEKIK
jgi:hypothetical protein